MQESPKFSKQSHQEEDKNDNNDLDDNKVWEVETKI